MKSSELGGIERGIDRRRGIFKHVLAPVSTSNVLHQFHIFKASISKGFLSAGLGVQRRCGRLTPRSGGIQLLMQSASRPSPWRKDCTAPSLELYPLHLGECGMDSKQNISRENNNPRCVNGARLGRRAAKSTGREKRNCLASHGIALSCEVRLVLIR